MLLLSVTVCLKLRHGVPKTPTRCVCLTVKVCLLVRIFRQLFLPYISAGAKLYLPDKTNKCFLYMSFT